MKKIIKQLIPICLMFALTVNAYAAFGGAAFLKKGVGARALGMGGAFTSLSNDTSAVYWNPAGLGQIHDYSVSVMGTTGASDEWQGLEDMTPSQNFAAVSVPMRKFTGVLGGSVFALGWINSSMDNITSSDDQGNEGKSFSDTQNAVYLSWGIPLWESSTNLYFGASLKYIMEKMDGIDGGTASGYDIDAGLLYNVFETLNFGMFLSKGAAMEWDGGESDEAALTAKFGVSNSFTLTEKMRLIGSLDLVQVQQEPLGGNIGLEFGYLDLLETDAFALRGLFLRGGVQGYALESRYGVKDDINKNVTYTVGFGIDMNVLGKYFQLDYAMGMGNLFDQQSKISLNFYF